MPRILLRSFSILFATLVFLASSQTIFAQGAPDCSNEKALKSPSSNVATELSFQNRSAEKRRIYWIDQDGDRKFYGIVEPGNAFRQPTSANHAWVVTDDAEKCLYAFVASAEPRAVEVGEAAAGVVAPPPGGQQPIAQAPVAVPAAPPPAPVVVQSPPSVPAPQVVQRPAQLPQAVVSDRQAGAAAQTADDSIPQVSPVEQFQLRGIYRLVTRLDGSKVLNSQASGTLEVTAAQPEWDSAQWSFESVAGTPFVRIKNAWKKTYLADFNGKPRAMPSAPDATEAHWTFEPVDGTNFVQFRNRETDRFLLSINGAAALVDDFRQEQENNSQWRAVAIAASGRPVAAAPAAPRNQAYDFALADCREIGGYWTGSSCRRPVYITEPLLCRRGFQWSEAAGECVWVGGGSCPPWQMGPGGACRRDLVCRGGVVEISGNGYQACYCPRGTVAWGDYPYLSCVPSISRVAPYLIPAVIGGVALGIISGGTNRPPVGPVFGNKKFCGPGQTGTPPNCVVAQGCKPPLVGTPPNCIRKFPNPNPTPVVSPTTIPVVTPTTTPVVAPTTTPVVTPTTTPGTTPGVVPSPTPTVNKICQIGETKDAAGNCVKLNASITCTGGRIEQGVCGCPQGTTLQGGGTNFQCVAAAGGTGTGTGTNRICQIGETKDAGGNCVKLNASITCTGGRIEQGVCGCPQGTTLQGGGTNFQCVAANTGVGQIGTATAATVDPNTGIQTTRTTDPKTGQTTTTQTCAAGFTGSPPNCVKQGGTTPTPLATPPCLEGQSIAQNNCSCQMKTVDVGGGKFICSANATAQPTTQPVGGPPLCTDGQNTASGCRCAAPLTVLPGGKCTQPTARGAACLEGQNIAQTGCNCVAPLKPIENGFCGRLLLNETQPLAKRTCAEGQDIRATGCSCQLKTVDVGGGKFICSANATPVNTNTNTGGGPPVCTDGQNTASGCRCAAPLTVLPGGKCTQPTARGAACLEGQNIAQTGCNCVAPLKPIENGFCGRLLLNETQPLAKRTCSEGQDIRATSCSCQMKTVDVGGGKFICSANAGPSGVRVAPAPTPTLAPGGRQGTTTAPSPTPTVAPKVTPSPTPTAVPKPTVAPSPTPTATPKPTVAPPPPPKPVTPPPPPPKPVVAPPPPKPVTAPPPPPKPVAPPPPPRPVAPPPPPPKPVVAPPPPPRPVAPPPGCAPPKKLNPAGQCV